MKILVINAGSSSLKYQFIEMEGETVLAKGICERIGIGGKIIHKTKDGGVFEEEVSFPTHTEAFEKLIKVLTTVETKIIDDMGEICAVGHRVVQGAELYSGSALITDKVLADIETLSKLAPLHNPAHALAIRACQKVLSASVPQVAVFDTAFHQTMQKHVYMFAVPQEFYTEHNIRKYGAHGTSHKFVSMRAAQMMGGDELKIVTCHLGNGSSITAVDSGKCVDTSMGLTPLDGILMGTRCGAIDPSAVLYMQEKTGMSAKEMSDFLNKKCGFLGVSELTSDFRDLTSAARDGNDGARLAYDMFVYQLKKYIGSYAAAMGGLDCVVFTGGIGENTSGLRRDVCKDLKFLGVSINDELNVEYNGKEKDISEDGAAARVLIVPTNEELAIARETMSLIV